MPERREYTRLGDWHDQLEWLQAMRVAVQREIADLDDDMDGTNRWFYHPFEYHGNKFGDPEGENDAQPSQSSGQSSGGSDEDDITDGGPCLSGLFNLKLTAMP